MKDLATQFEDPSAEFRGKPFWSWNGDLQKDELIRQIHVMKEMGLGGFFMHSRTGLITEYLGDTWFELTNDCADEAERLGMEAWLYDEDRWPSGTAGGMVTQNPAYRANYLRLHIIELSDFQWDNDFIAAFTCKLEGNAYFDLVRIEKGDQHVGTADRTVLAFTIEVQAESSFYNGETYVDTLNGDATREFIELTHERYKAHCGTRLGKSIRGIFTDEPHRGAVMNGFGVGNLAALQMTPWTELLPQRFAEVFHQDILDLLPEIFLSPNGETICATKWQYMEILQQMFLDNFAKPLYDWCEDNGMRLTGHVLHEDSLTAQAAMQGSLMRFYEYMHDPGIDVLTEMNRNPMIAKQLSSAARQLGQKWLLSELYGCTGWQMDFRDHKEVGDWQALFGINLRCHHLSWYTMLGEAKRDYPGSILHQSAWYKDYNYVETYFARIGLMLAQGQPNCDILVINPIESLWCQIGLGWASGLSANTDALIQIETDYSALSLSLLQGHIDFDLGDEDMIKRLGSAIETPHGAVLQVGQARYRAVVVPHLATVRSSTLQLLEQFREAGGTVIFAGPPPDRVDCRVDNRAALLAAKAVSTAWDQDQIVGACRQAVQRDITIFDTSTGQNLYSVFCQTRTLGTSIIVAALNTAPQEIESATFRVRGHGTVEEWDCRTGQRYGISSTAAEGWIEFTTCFAESGERLYVVGSDAPLAPNRTVHTPGQSHVFDGPFDYVLDEDNICLLDTVRWSVDGSAWSEPAEVLQADRLIRHHLGIPLRGGEMVQPWFQAKYHPTASSLGELSLLYQFNVDTIPNGELFLCIESPDTWNVTVNETKVELRAAGWWVDTAFARIPLSAESLKMGLNSILLTTRFQEKTNIESVYIAGHFGVTVSGADVTLINLPAQVEVGDLVRQGFPFYGGSITYRIAVPANFHGGSAAEISVPEFAGACIRVNQAGQQVGTIAFPPYECAVSEITESKIDLTVVLTRRNTFGPFHQLPAMCDGYGPANFTTEGDNFTTDYNLFPAGLLRSPEISWS